MANGSRTGALTIGLIFIIVGSIFFLENWYPSLSAWDLLLRYWPIILILIGARKLYFYFSWKEAPPLPNSQDKE